METLTDYLNQHAAEGFQPVPHYFKDGDFINFFLTDERCYAERVDNLLTVFLSDETGQLVGCKLKGIRLLLDKLEESGTLCLITIDDGDVRLDWLFISVAALSGAPARVFYCKLRDLAKDAKIARQELAQAAA